MKKLMSVTLALLLIVSTLTCMLTSQASAATAVEITPQSTDPNFAETDEVTYPDGSKVYKMATNNSLYVTATLETDTYYTFTFSYSHTGVEPFRPHDGNTFVIAGTPDFTGGAKIARPTDGRDLSLNTVNNGANIRDAGVWRCQSIDFKTNSTDTTYSVVVGFNNNPGGYLSNIKLVKKSSATELNFKTSRHSLVLEEAAEGVEAPAGFNGTVYSLTGTAQTVGDVNIDKGSMVATALDLKANTAYTFTFYYRNQDDGSRYFRPIKENSGVFYAEKDITAIVGGSFGEDQLNQAASIEGGNNSCATTELDPSLNYGSYAEGYRANTMEFTTTNAGRYAIVISFTNGPSAYVAFDLKETVYSVNAAVEGNGYVEIDSDVVAKGEDAILYAEPYGDDEFLGWYDADYNLVSEDQELTIENVAADINVTAVFTGTLIDLYPSLGIHNPDYAREELDESELPEGVSGPGYKAYGLSGNALTAELKGLMPNTSYHFSMWLKGDAKVDNIPINVGSEEKYTYELCVVDARAGFPSQPDGRQRHWSGAYYTENVEYAVNYIDAWPAIDTASGDEWRQYDFYFTTDGASDYIVAMKMIDGNGSSYQYWAGASLEVEEIGAAPSGADLLGTTGVSLRKENESENGQALRFKNTIGKEVIGELMDDNFIMMEYGSIVATLDSLDAYGAFQPSLVQNTANAYTVLKAVAYERAAYDDEETLTNIVFSEDEEDITFTLALYNISVANYGKVYAVRPYAKFVDADGNHFYRYGETQYASVYDVAWEILNADPAVADDVAYVNDTLLPAGSEAKTGYDAWVESRSDAE